MRDPAADYLAVSPQRYTSQTAMMGRASMSGRHTMCVPPSRAAFSNASFLALSFPVWYSTALSLPTLDVPVTSPRYLHPETVSLPASWILAADGERDAHPDIPRKRTNRQHAGALQRETCFRFTIRPPSRCSAGRLTRWADGSAGTVPDRRIPSRERGGMPGGAAVGMVSCFMTRFPSTYPLPGASIPASRTAETPNRRSKSPGNPRGLPDTRHIGIAWRRVRRTEA